MGWHLEEFSLEVAGRWRVVFAPPLRGVSTGGGHQEEPLIEKRHDWDPAAALPPPRRASRFGPPRA